MARKKCFQGVRRIIMFARGVQGKFAIFSLFISNIFFCFPGGSGPPWSTLYIRASVGGPKTVWRRTAEQERSLLGCNSWASAMTAAKDRDSGDSVPGPYVPAGTNALGEARSEFFKPITTDMQLPKVMSSNPSRAAGENPIRRIYLFYRCISISSLWEGVFQIDSCCNVCALYTFF